MMILLARIKRELLLFLQEGEYFFEHRKKWKKKEKSAFTENCGFFGGISCVNFRTI